MELSIKELLTCKFFSASQVLAGEKGLGNIVSSVTVLDSPDAPRYIKGGELVVTTAYSLLNDDIVQKKVVEELAKNGAAGLGLKMRFLNNVLPEAMKKSADVFDFPIISLPNEYAYTDIYDFINSNMISPLTKEIKREEEVLKEINASFHDEGLYGVVKVLNKWTGLVAVLSFKQQINVYPKEVTLQDFPFDLQKWCEKPLAKRINTDVKCFCWERENLFYEWISDDIIVEEIPQGYVFLLKSERNFEKSDYFLLDYAASACTMEIERTRTIIKVRRKYNKKFLESFLKGEFTWDEAKYQAGELDFTLPEEGIAVVVNIMQDSLNFYDERFVDTIEHLVAKIFGNGIVYGLIDDCTVLYISDDFDKYSVKIKNLYSELKTAFNNAKILIGLGRPASFKDAAKSFEEAKKAIKIGLCIDLEPSIYYFNNLGFYRLLHLPEVDQEIKRYYEDYLKPLLIEEKESNCELLKTLECFIESCYNFRDTSRKLFVHPNTVRYRIATVEKLCRVNLKYADDRLNMAIALRLLPLIKKG